MVALHTQAARALDRAGLRCPSDRMPSSRKITIGQGLLFPEQPDRGRIATYRAGLGPDLWGNASFATFVGARGAIGALRVYIVKS